MAALPPIPVSSSGSQVVRLGSRLIVGIRIHGTLVDFSGRFGRLFPRPHLSYFSKVLQKLQCDVTLFTHTNMLQEKSIFSQFIQHDFTCPFRFEYDNSKAAVISRPGGRGGSSIASTAARNCRPPNYQQRLETIAADQKSVPSRVLFIDSEISHRCSPACTLLLDPYLYEQRRLRNSHLVKLTDCEEQNARIAQYTDLLAGQSVVSSGGGAMDESKSTKGTAGRRVRGASSSSSSRCGVTGSDLRWGPIRDVDDVNDCNGGSGGEEGEEELLGKPTQVPFADECGLGRGPVRKNTSGSRVDPAGAAVGNSLAMTAEDYTLVALAEMIKEVAASDMPVNQYLKLEPMIEKLTVPLHGQVFYLPTENCDYIDMMDLEHMEVTPPVDVVPDVEETAAHDGLFQ